MTHPRSSTPQPPDPARQRGLALLIVLWTAILLAILAGGVTQLSRGDLNLARNLAEGARAEAAADSALNTAIYRIVSDRRGGWALDGTVYAWRFGAAEVRLRATDELGRIDLNAAPQELLAALFTAAGTDPAEAVALAEAVEAYRADHGGGGPGPRRPLSRREPSSAEAGAADGGATEGGSDDGSGGDGSGEDGGAPALPFATTAALARVPGMPPGLVGAVADAVTVYTGLAAPRAVQSPPLVLAALATSGTAGPSSAAGADPDTGPGDSGGDLPLATLDPSEGLPRPGEAEADPGAGPGGRSVMIRLEAESLTDTGAAFAREAVVELRRSPVSPYQLRLWRRGERRLFPVTAPGS